MAGAGRTLSSSPFDTYESVWCRLHVNLAVSACDIIVCCTGYCHMCLGIKFLYILLNVVSEEILDVKGYSAVIFFLLDDVTLTPVHKPLHGQITFY